LTYTVDNVPPAKFLNHSDDIHKSMLGFHSKSILITTENHHAGDAFMLASLLFTLARQ